MQKYNAFDSAFQKVFIIGLEAGLDEKCLFLDLLVLCCQHRPPLMKGRIASHLHVRTESFHVRTESFVGFVGCLVEVVINYCKVLLLCIDDRRQAITLRCLSNSPPTRALRRRGWKEMLDYVKSRMSKWHFHGSIWWYLIFPCQACLVTFGKSMTIG